MPNSYIAGSHNAIRTFAIVLLSLASFGILAMPASASEIKVMVDEAKIIELNRPVSQVIIGNPAIADVTVQSRQMLVFTGKSSGHTNIILLDENNRQVLNEKVHVTTANAKGLVIVQRGGTRHSYHCGSVCNGRVSLGDDPNFTKDVLKSTESKLQFARDAANGNR